MLNHCQTCFAELRNAEERLHGLCGKHITAENIRIFYFDHSVNSVKRSVTKKNKKKTTVRHSSYRESFLRFLQRGQ